MNNTKIIVNTDILLSSEKFVMVLELLKPHNVGLVLDGCEQI